ncbi:MAG: DUF664 domain-containing protein [Bacteroidia bacterium]|nr:DUF664 domain-containing protein [Bacteroidia bacterium]
MDALDLIKEKLAYNQWANQLVVDWIRNEPKELYQKEVVSSFTSIQKLLKHMMETEKYYFSLIRKTEEEYPEGIPTEGILEELLEINQNILGWLSNQSVEDVLRTISIKRSPMVEHYTTVALLTHLVNHSTYHRGQLLALRHQLGMSSPPKLDYYRYLISLSMKNQG